MPLAASTRRRVTWPLSRSFSVMLRPSVPVSSVDSRGSSRVGGALQDSNQGRGSVPPGPACARVGAALPSWQNNSGAAATSEREVPVSAHLSPAQIKSRLDHPIIDADGHWIEYGPVFTEQLRKIGGEAAVRGWSAVGRRTRGVLAVSVEEPRPRRIRPKALRGDPAQTERDLPTC